LPWGGGGAGGAEEGEAVEGGGGEVDLHAPWMACEDEGKMMGGGDFDFFRSVSLEWGGGVGKVGV
jgi:hypothetical protein